MEFMLHHTQVSSISVVKRLLFLVSAHTNAES